MSVLIKGMEMPKEDSWITVRIYPDGTCAVPNWQGDCTLIKEAKAIPVPPHGRLIDETYLNMLIHTAKEIHANEKHDFCNVFDSNGQVCTEWWCVEDMIENAHTIIPAEPPKEET